MRNRPASRALLSLVLLSLLAAGCAAERPPATTQYKQTQDETVYRARSLNLGTMFPTGGLSRDPSVSLRSWAVCSGEKCQPQEAWFSFLLRSSNRSSVLSSRDVTIKTDGNVHTWPEEQQRLADRLQTNKGSMQLPGGGGNNELVRISMDMNTLQDIAQSKKMFGKLGDQDFSLSYEDRAPLRALLKEIRNPSPKGGTS